MSQRIKNLAALISVYIAWSSTYYAIKITVATIPPLLSTGIRLIIAGSIILLFMKIRGHKFPPAGEWLNAAIIGTLLFGGGAALVAIAEVNVSSSVAVIAIAATSLWMGIISAIFGKFPTKMEWAGIIIGFLGIVILNWEKELQTNALSAVLLIISPITWCVGSMFSQKLTVSTGFLGTGMKMFTGGLVVSVTGVFMGERFTMVPSYASIFGLIYLITVGSLIGFSSYMYLLHHVRPALATSYSYVNPIGGVIIGVLIGGEVLGQHAVIALISVVAGVVLVSFGNNIENRRLEARK